MAKTKILVLQMKELIYTAIFAGFLILLIVLLVIMFSPSDKKDQASHASADSIYSPGVYNSQIALGDALLNVEVVVDADQINSISFVNLDSSVETMYPLLSPSMETIEEQLIHGTNPDEVQLSEKGKFTETLLLEGVKTALNKALVNPV
ncbi:MAG: hypothetical protein J5972_05690 [Eubacterium sp.]|nr:hypothetical protein [Eubacterium sp.]